jgi:hypothetical protein
MAIMKMYAIILSTLTLLSSCSVLKSKSAMPPGKKEPKTRAAAPVSTPETAPKKVRLSKAIWHLIEPLGLEIQVTSLDKKLIETITIDKTISQVEMDPGDWQITGFTLDGKKFEILEHSKNFGFKLKKNAPAYAGSIIVQCPTVGKTYVEELKKMSFFNRLSFKNGNNLCEMVVGDQYKTVKKVWENLSPDKKKTKITMGF